MADPRRIQPGGATRPAIVAESDPHRIGDVDLEPYLQPAPLVVILSGPSGAGKDACVARMKEMGYPLHFVVTATTRPQRPGEVHGVDYLFCSRTDFEGMIDRGELFEHAVVYGEYKGIPKEQVRKALASGEDVIMRLDVQGAARIRELMPEAVFIFVTASSEEELARRLCARGTEGEEALRRRLATARDEMREIHRFDYVVVNREGELDATVQRILAIMQAEKSRARPRKVAL